MHFVSTNTASAAAMARPGTKRSAGPGPGQTGITRAPWRESGPYAGYVIRRLIAEYRARAAAAPLALPVGRAASARGRGGQRYE